jgi:hypothetical protein
MWVSSQGMPFDTQQLTDFGELCLELLHRAEASIGELCLELLRRAEASITRSTAHLQMLYTKSYLPTDATSYIVPLLTKIQKC